MNSKLVQEGNKAIKRHFLGWRDPPVDLPADSVIDTAVMEIVMLAWTWNSGVDGDAIDEPMPMRNQEYIPDSEVEPDGRDDRREG